MRLWSTALALLASSASAAAQGNVLVVNSAGGAPYTQIQTAVDAAAEGDVVLVKTGSYAPVTIDNRAIAVVGDASATVQINGSVDVRNLALQRSVLLHRLRVASASYGLSITDDIGAVRVQSCLVQAGQGTAEVSGVRVVNSRDVALTDTQSIGGVVSVGSGWLRSADGVLADDASVAIYDCGLFGGNGYHPPNGSAPPACFGGHGGRGLRGVGRDFLFCARAYLVGGEGADASDGCPSGSGSADTCCPGGNGGEGLYLGSPSPKQTLWGMENWLQGGAPGFGGHGNCGCGISVSCTCDPGVVGAGLVIGNDVLVSLPGTCPSLSASVNPVRELNMVVLTVQSAPGDVVTLIVSERADFEPEPGRGVRLLDRAQPYLVRALGTTNSSGNLQRGWAIADLGAGVQSRVLHAQALVKHTNGQLVWSNPVQLVVLDQAF